MKNTTASRHASLSKFHHQSFDPVNLTKAINLLSYGILLTKHHKANGKPTKRIYYIFEDDSEYLQYIHEWTSYVDCRIPLLDIHLSQEIRDKPTSETFKTLDQKRCLQINFSSKNHVLMFDSQIQRDLFWQGLQYFIGEAEKEQDSLKRKDITNYLGQKMFFQADEDGSKSLSYAEVRKIIMQLQVDMPEQRLQELFNQYDMDGSGTIEYDEFQKLVKNLVSYESLKPIYMEYASYSRGKKEIDLDEGLMTKNDFHHFITQVQQEQMMPNEVNELFQHFSKASHLHQNQQVISFTSFINYLLSDLNDAFDVRKSQIYQSTQYPLNDYWINSSHNTYLMSNQLTGESSIQAYINAFQKGCRCVELDCWDGNGHPIIYHGYTMTTKITFESVIQTIAEYGFKYSSFPLILSLEVHCSLQQQDVMADIMLKYFTNKIFIIPQEYKTQKYYPTLDQLNNKIILKNKGKIQSGINYRLKQNLQSQLDLINNNDDEQEEEDQDSQRSVERHFKNRQMAIQKLGLKQLLLNPIQQQQQLDTLNQRIHSTIFHQLVPQDNQDVPPQQYEDINYQDHQDTANNKNINSTIYPVTITSKYRTKSSSKQQKTLDRQKTAPNELKQSVHHESLKLCSITALFGISMAFDKPRTVWEISSLDENKLASLLKTQEQSLLAFHRNYFTRIYPAGSRVDSSNYDPIPSFNTGSQIIALNFQTNDLHLMLNLAKFHQNGGIQSGYLLKPPWMRSDAKQPKLLSDFKSPIMQLNINFISGQNLKAPNQQDLSDIIDPFLKVYIKGITTDETANPPSTSKVVQNNGLNPKFNFFYNAKLRCPDLAMLVIEVYDEDTVKNDFIGWTAIPIPVLQQGYRNIQLQSNYLKPIPDSSLFAFIALKNIP